MYKSTDIIKYTQKHTYVHIFLVLYYKIIHLHIYVYEHDLCEIYNKLQNNFIMLIIVINWKIMCKHN